MKEYLVHQSAHLSAQSACEFQQTTTALRQKWKETQMKSTAILATPSVGFRTQFRLS